MTRTRVRAIVLLGCLALIVASLAGPRQASAQSDQWDALFDRMIRLEHEVKAMQSGGGAVALNPSAIGSSGAVEDQLRQVMAMLDQIRQTQRSLEMRLERLEGTSPGTTGGTTGSIYEPQSHAPYAQGENSSFDFSQYQSRELAQLSAEQDVTIYREYEPQAVAQPQVLGTLSGTQAYGQGYQSYQTQGYQSQGFQTQTYDQDQPASSGGYGASDVSSSLLPETVESASLDSAALPSTGGSSAATSDGSAEKLYQGGYESLLGRRFGDAEGSFKMFVDRHRDHPLASDAHFWLGETFYVQGDYKQAAQSFLKGYRDYPDGRKAPDTLFKLALSLQQLEQTSQACSTFAEVAKKYPTAANVRNEALKEMQRAGC
jgi:tol-pal system protein YbgF